MTIGDRIKELRTKLGITQDELASYANTTKQTIHKYEVGIIQNIPASKIKLLSEKLQTTPAYLMGWEESAKTSSYNLPNIPSPSEVDPDAFAFQMYKELDSDDKAEIRGEMKQMLKADKYNNDIIKPKRKLFSDPPPARVAASGMEVTAVDNLKK